MDYRIIDGSDNMKIEDIVRLLRMTYWANERPEEKIKKSIQNSSCYGIVLEEADKLVGFARVISDYATTYYICDVIVDPEYRNMGFGCALLSHIESMPDYAWLRGFLITRDAQDFYRKFGFEVVNDRIMVKAP
ncbi:MAG: GNAT family N-acetyltransferase [Oscillospiraceae bacterium]|nr:GNAT family N-acetyltransferase [Oscillospiraceae bacterium]